MRQQPATTLVSPHDITPGLIEQFRTIVDGWDGRVDGSYDRISRADLIAQEPSLRQLHMPEHFSIGSNSIYDIVARDVEAWIREHQANGTPQLAPMEARARGDGSYEIIPPVDLINRIKRDLITERARAMS